MRSSSSLNVDVGLHSGSHVLTLIFNVGEHGLKRGKECERCHVLPNSDEDIKLIF